jgi:hypothetical protein
VINPSLLERAPMLAASVVPLCLGRALVEVDTGLPGAAAKAIAGVAAALGM